MYCPGSPHRAQTSSCALRISSCSFHSLAYCSQLFRLLGRGDIKEIRLCAYNGVSNQTIAEMTVALRKETAIFLLQGLVDKFFNGRMDGRRKVIMIFRRFFCQSVNGQV